MIGIIQKILDAIMVVVGFVFGKKQSDLEHELAAEKSTKNHLDRIREKQKSINDEYNKIIRDYNDHLNDGLPKRD